MTCALIAVFWIAVGICWLIAGMLIARIMGVGRFCVDRSSDEARHATDE